MPPQPPTSSDVPLGLTPMHLGQMCVRAAERSLKVTVDLPGLVGISHRRLFDDDSPEGDIVCEVAVGGQTFQRTAFDPLEVLAFLAANGLVQVTGKIQQ